MSTPATQPDWNTVLRWVREGRPVNLVGMVVTKAVVEEVAGKPVARVGIACNTLEVDGVTQSARRRQYFEVTREVEAHRFASRMGVGMLVHISGVGMMVSGIDARSGAQKGVLTIAAHTATVIGRGETGNIDRVEITERSL